MKQRRQTTATKIIPMVLVCLYAIIIGVFLFLTDLSMYKAMQIFLVICSTLLLTDVSKTIKDTYNLGGGNYKEIYTPYYVVCWICTLLLIGVIFIIKDDYHNFTEEINLLLSALGIIMSEFIGVLMGNKLATGQPKGEE